MFKLREGFGDTEKADHRHDERHTPHEIDRSVSEPGLGGHRVEPDHPDHNAKRPSKCPFGKAFARERADQKDPDDAKQHVIARCELDCEIGDQRGCDGKGQHADKSADHRHHRREANCLAREALARQWITVQCGGNGTGGPRNIEQDRGACASVNATDIDAGNQRKGFVHLPFEGEGNQDRRGHGHRQTWDRTDIDPGKRAKRCQQKKRRVQPRGGEKAQCFHHVHRLPVGRMT